MVQFSVQICVQVVRVHGEKRARSLTNQNLNHNQPKCEPKSEQ